MASWSTWRFSGLAESVFELKRTMRLKKLISPFVRWRHAAVIDVEGEEKCNGLTNGSTLLITNGKKKPPFPVSLQNHRHVTNSASVLQVPVLKEPGALHDIPSNPEKLTESDLESLCSEIKKELCPTKGNLEDIAGYYFDGKGKIFRPMVVVLMAKAINAHLGASKRLTESQRILAKIVEMVHCASLIHDDVIDTSDTRRGKPSANALWGQRKAVLAGDFLLARTSRLLARTRNEDVVEIIYQIIVDLVHGEFIQMGTKEDECERFADYLQKSFKKTASLLAYSCRAVALLADADESLKEAAFQYGRNIGIAFQLVDDLLDFVSNEAELGKPAVADLKLGLATAPVLFAAEKFPELNEMIIRRFSEPGDVQQAYDAVMKSEGIESTRILARQHCNEALRHITQLADSPEKRALMVVTDRVLNRKK